MLNLLEDEFVIAPGVAPPPIEVDIQANGGSIRAKGERVGEALLLCPANGGDVQVGQMGFSNLAPGRYTVYSVKDISKLEYRNPEVMRTLRGGVTVDVAAGATVEVAPKEAAQ
jgi:hypothetical protein